MSAGVRRRRGLVLLALALASGGLAASQLQDRVRAVEARVGPLVPVAVAARDLPADAWIGRGALTTREVPARFVPPDALASARAAAGLRTAVPLAAGSYLTRGHLQGAARGSAAATGGPLGRGRRAVEVAVAGSGALDRAAPGSRVDVVVSTESRTGAGGSFLALEDVELLGLRSAAPDALAQPGDAAAGALATLRVTLRQAVYLAAAENFAREVRLLVRPPGDRELSGGVEVSAGDL